MKVTSKGQVTIPQHVRDELNIRPAEDEVEFVKTRNGAWIIRKALGQKRKPSRFARLRGTATVRMSTDEIMSLTRG
ncbi:MAG: AbrB/MazE/SpoVT family DNA-binding domain-containing protein [Proteobacteria bacterium]|nr:AbrB/MazE/SpoVT family DNA-binding domain-containing protein [Pseudomonadota bacterium]